MTDPESVITNYQSGMSIAAIRQAHGGMSITKIYSILDEAGVVGDRDHPSRTTLTCAHCGESREVYRSQTRNLAQWYCSRGCRSAPHQIQVACAHCGVAISVPRSKLTRQKHVFCDKRCKDLWRGAEGERRARERYEKNE